MDQVTQALQQQNTQQAQQSLQQVEQQIAQAAGGQQQAGAEAELEAQLTVTQQQPQVTVRQQPPQITVTIPKPIVTVTIPEPQVDIQMPEPQVDVQQQEPDVQISMGQLQVEGTQAQAADQIEQMQAQVQVEQDEPQIRIQQEQPEIRITRAGQQGQQQEQQQAQADQQQQTQEYIAQGVARFSKLRNINVQISRGDATGSINDLVVYPQGNTPFALVQFQQQGQQSYVVPLQVISFNWQQQNAEINLSNDEINVLPSVQGGQLPDTSQQGWDRQWYQFWQDAEGMQSYEQAEGAGSQAVLASQLSDYSVRNNQGQDLGSIEDIVVHVQDRKVHYIALSSGGVLGIGGNLLALPMQNVQLNQQENALVVNVTEQQLQNVQGFNPNNWPQEANQQLMQGGGQQQQQQQQQQGQQDQGQQQGNQQTQQ
jgi:sporulation protein YlmC with PRC-barrel domain